MFICTGVLDLFPEQGLRGQNQEETQAEVTIRQMSTQHKEKRYNNQSNSKTEGAVSYQVQAGGCKVTESR